MKIEDLVRRDAEKLTSENLEDYRRVWAKVLGRMPKNSEIWPFVEDEEIKELYKTRSVRTESGVAPFAVMMKPHYCPGNCVYCPLEAGMPKSYLSDEPAAQRAKKLKFDPYLQVEMRLKQLEETGHITNKIDLIVIGGTFSAYPEEYKLEFFKGMYDGVNGFVSDSLEEAQKFNEMGERRIVGISVETRPDWVTEEEIILWRKMGVTKIQLGVQAFDEQILQKINRGHSLREVAEATRMCRNAGIKICYHFMPNLPGSTPENDIEMAKIMFTDPRFQPDYLKVYPAMVIPGTELFNMWKRGEYKSYNDMDLIRVLKEVKNLTPRWCRIDRLVRDISKQWVSSGTLRTNLRQMLQEELKKEGKKCHCMRCREVRAGVYDAKVQLVIDERTTLGGQELFLSFESQDKLFSMLRLRLPGDGERLLFKELEDAAIIREVHTYGQVREIDKELKNSRNQELETEKEQDKSQHQGLGKRLMVKAEEIARERGYSKMAVISAIGTREYYKKLGYELEGEYMIKRFIE
ncbi:TPA: tRNA uridine(34) 5-carboxymethylaminomethyl modification radical SAM/GNAT enzyme Elp3 [Candidatus Collierbacteria bacterium]|nr:MAG: Histone acetyltransferase, ELP3 family [Candidatus Collierbacteria bacterium GW2011_GWA2_44_13]KKT50105.1 MAG: Histone acetyltransferase, ELP3 family [Candidatus Collierbacteria bacterium GW2011_GWB1_44_197]KKT62509.1 MAG: Histone acetyltransferase, ELP3 family [Candidatus Collierbacteria bacterium GW2011_GWD1_44_27]KKT88758.1 MAG: Histone acetyltransferase, ELP3 family [Candidatus Collierbacteria bacterium GW2011_GWD2_45_10]HCQ31593.1 tRNA uridine(34) 5-carboxymethylaminomethyl modific